MGCLQHTVAGREDIWNSIVKRAFLGEPGAIHFYNNSALDRVIFVIKLHCNVIQLPTSYNQLPFMQ